MIGISGDVTVAIIGAFAALGAAAIGALGEAIRRNARATRKAVGTPNGDGTVITLLERVLAGQAGQDKRLANLEANQADHDTRLRRLERQAS